MYHLLAQNPRDVGSPLRGIGFYGLQTGSGDPGSRFNQFISTTIGVLTLIAGVWFFFVLVSGAIAWIGAGGDKAKVIEARQRITMGLVGLVVVVSALFIAEIVGGLLGFPAITDPGSLIPALGP